MKINIKARSITLTAMTPLFIFQVQRDHVVFVCRVSKRQLLEQRKAFERAYRTSDDIVQLPVPTRFLRRCKPTLDLVYARLNGAGRAGKPSKKR